jgi:hypothetical protein
VNSLKVGNICIIKTSVGRRIYKFATSEEFVYDGRTEVEGYEGQIDTDLHFKSHGGHVSSGARVRDKTG